MKQEEKREALRRDLLREWLAYEETGLHVTGDMAIAWLETWGTQTEKEPPKDIRLERTPQS